MTFSLPLGSLLLGIAGIWIGRTLTGDVDDITDADNLVVLVVFQILLAMAGRGCVLQGCHSEELSVSVFSVAGGCENKMYA